MHGSARVSKKVTCTALLLFIVVIIYCLINLSSRIQTNPFTGDIDDDEKIKNYAEISLPFNSLRNLTTYVRIYRDIRKKLKSNKNQFTTKFEQDTFPWLNDKPMLDFVGKNMSRGIVVCMSDKYMNVGLPALLSLNDLGSQLPIEIMYYGENDLSIKNRRKLSKVPNVVEITDLSTKFINVSLRSWAAKPFAILASIFQHVILIDSDVYFFQLPEKLFDDHDYVKENIMLFTDRSLEKDTARTKWVNSILPPPFSKSFNESRMVRGLARDEIEAGVVVMNKGNDDIFLGLLVICVLNVPPYCIYPYVHGDKETFWLGMEMIQKTFYVNPITGVIGDVVNDIVCGQIAHGNRNKRLLWWNGGLFQDKFSRPFLLNFTYYSWEPTDQYFSWKASCLYVNKTEYRKLDEHERNLIRKYKETMQNVCRKMAAEGESCLPSLKTK
ncbi:unnamed protein product [Didymodactylos carnosus]|uniref:Glycosyltransferase n=1 Tax=Didymodactylos carnosus TaxID=1234261 RepID=A0A814N248_9BILA|nr:unnamed protein product [Didymodactylos carnosus]CAF3852843.1 unnamed protein product [Didymodactylos carnosus]